MADGTTELDAFTARLGDGQGRVVADDGSVTFILGDVGAGRVVDLVVGDHVGVSQPIDVTGVALVRANLRLRAPASMPTGVAWEVSIVVDGAKCARATCAPGRSRVISDLAANVSKLAGVHTVGVRLELVVVG
ncbi:MAG: hypothetical protein ACHREM_33495 [Polyangiales bacterium]